MKSRLKLLIADDQEIVRKAVTRLIEAQEDMEVIGEASGGQEAVDKALLCQPDVVILDISMPPGIDGLEATHKIKRNWPETQVLILTMHDEPDYLFRVLREGASGYLLKNALGSELITAIRVVADQQVYLYPTAAKILVEDLLTRQNGTTPKAGVRTLSDREREILILIAKGYSNKEIGDQLFISVKTVETHKKHIMEKLNLSKKHELVNYALENNLLSAN